MTSSSSSQRFVSFPAIGEYRKVIKAINDGCNYHKFIKKPILRFFGTTKIHGTNAAVVLQRGGQVYAQSRENVLSEDLPHEGFYAFVEATRAHWQKLLEDLLALPEHADADTIALYGEWCGGDLHQGIAITGLPMMFVIFRLKTQKAGMVKDTGVEVPGYISTYHPVIELTEKVLPRIPLTNDERFMKTVYVASQFQSWMITIDFNSPKEMQNILGQLTNEVEEQCPFGKAFGRTGVGEGIVWSLLETNDLPFRTDNLMFKVKGKKHSDTNVKILAQVDVETIKSVREFAELVCTDHRFEKGVAHLKAQPGAEANVLIPANAGLFIRWVLGDVKKEEADTLAANGLSDSDVLSSIALRAKAWFLGQTK